MARRPKRPRAVASFSSTFDAMAAEGACKDAGVEGRLIPTPVAISAECGMAWSMPPEERGHFESVMAERALRFAVVTDLEL